MKTEEQLQKITQEVNRLRELRMSHIPRYVITEYKNADYNIPNSSSYLSNVKHWKDANSLIDAESKARKEAYYLKEELRKKENGDPEKHSEESKKNKNDAIKIIVNKNINYYVANPDLPLYELGNDYVESVCEMYLENAKQHSESELNWHVKQREAILNNKDYHNENRRDAANTRWIIETNKHWEESLKEYSQAEEKRLTSDCPHIWQQIANFYWEEAWHWAQAELTALSPEESNAATEKWNIAVNNVVIRLESLTLAVAKQAGAKKAVQNWIAIANSRYGNTQPHTIQPSTSIFTQFINMIRRVFYIRARDPEQLMYDAITANDVNSIALLLTSPKIILARNSQRWLSLASENGQTKTIQLLLNAGININEDPRQRNAIGLPPVAIAAIYSNTDAVRELILRGADLEAVVTSKLAQCEQYYGKTALGCVLDANKDNSIETARLLIANGASVGTHYVNANPESSKIIDMYLPHAANQLAFYWDTPDHYAVIDDSMLLDHAVNNIIAPDLQRVFAINEAQARACALTICNQIRNMTNEEVLEQQLYIIKPATQPQAGTTRLIETMQIRIGKHFREHLDPSITAQQLVLEFQTAFNKYVPADKLHYMHQLNRDQMAAMANKLANALPADKVLGLQELQEIFKQILQTATESYAPPKPTLLRRIINSITSFFKGEQSQPNPLTMEFDPEAINSSNERLKTWILKNLNFRLHAVGKMIAAVQNGTLPPSTQSAIQTEISSIEDDWKKFISATSEQQTIEIAQEYVTSRSQISQQHIQKRTWLPSARLSREQTEADVVQELANIVQNKGGNQYAL